jgi:hypothetical protein
LVGMAAARLGGEDFLVGLDRQRVDVAGQHLAPAAGLSSTTAAGLAKRFSAGQWAAVETALGDVHSAMLDMLPAARTDQLTESVTIRSGHQRRRGLWPAQTGGSPTTTLVNAVDARMWRPGPRSVPRWARTCWPVIKILGPARPSCWRRCPATPVVLGSGCVLRVATSRASWPAPRWAPISSSRSARTASPRCGRPCPGSPRRTGLRRSTGHTPRSRWPTTPPAGGRRPPDW